jgi:hypothetical protein
MIPKDRGGGEGVGVAKIVIGTFSRNEKINPNNTQLKLGQFPGLPTTNDQRLPSANPVE